MNKIFRLVTLCSTAAFLLACGNNSNTTAAGADAASKLFTTASSALPALAPLAVDAYRAPASGEAAGQQNSPMKARNLSLTTTLTLVALGAPSSKVLVAAQATPMEVGKPIQESFSRASVQTTSAAATAQVLKWQKSPAGGQAAALSFTSTNAKGMRIGLLVTQLPASATLRYYAQGAASAYEVSGAEVLSILAQNAAAGDTTGAGRTYWGPLLESPEMTLEIELPPGVSTSELVVAVPTVMHSFRSSSEIQTQAAFVPALTCNKDINCLASKPAVSNAVVFMSFITGANSGYTCTGTMLNNSLLDGTPYMLTSNRCISTQTMASSVFPSLFKLSNSCDSPNSSGHGLTSGSTLLFSSYNTDSTLVRLNANVAGYFNAYFAGWDASTPPALALTVDTIHHPKSDPQRISGGAVDKYWTKDTAGNWSPSTMANSTFVGVNLTSGVIEDGSQGSGMFKNIATNPQLIGQLWGGVAPSCSTPTTSNPQAIQFGRFDVAFNAGMSDWLTHGLKPVYRFYNNSRGTHFFSQSITEKNFISANYPQFSYENAVFNAYSNADAATRSPVFRFYNSATQSHFYTIDVAEKDGIRAKIASGAWPQFAFEGTSWYAKTPTQFAAAAEGTIPLYRFYRTNGTHFYTADLAEKISIQANLSAYYTYEGIAYYVWP